MVFLRPPFKDRLIFRTEAITLRPKFPCVAEVETISSKPQNSRERENE